MVRIAWDDKGTHRPGVTRSLLAQVDMMSSRLCSFFWPPHPPHTCAMNAACQNLSMPSPMIADVDPFVQEPRDDERGRSLPVLHATGHAGLCGLELPGEDGCFHEGMFLAMLSRPDKILPVRCQ